MNKRKHRIQKMNLVCIQSKFIPRCLSLILVGLKILYILKQLDFIKKNCQILKLYKYLNRIDNRLDFYIPREESSKDTFHPTRILSREPEDAIWPLTSSHVLKGCIYLLHLCENNCQKGCENTVIHHRPFLPVS